MPVRRLITVAFSLAAALLLVGARQTGAQGAIEGRVLAKGGTKPVPGATVTLPGFALETHADSTGAFRLSGVPDGTHNLRVESSGYAQIEQLVTVPSNAPLRIELVPAVVTLSSTRVYSPASMSPGLAEFEERRASNRGRFITGDKFDEAGGRRLGDVIARAVPGLAFRTVRGGRAFASRRGSVAATHAVCYPSVWVDGFARYAGTGDPFNIDSIDPSLVAAAEFHTAASLPGRYNPTGDSPCGALLIWLKH